MRIKERVNRFNTIKYKVELSLIIISIIPLLSYMLWINSYAINKFYQLEEKTLLEESRHSFEILNSITRYTKKIINDYSIWDEGYYRIKNNDKAWIKNNYSSTISESYNMDLVLLINNKKEVIDNYGVDKATLKSILNDRNVSDILSNKFKVHNNSIISGLNILNNNLYILAMHPILKERKNKNSIGIMIIGKKVDKKFLKDIFEKHNLDIFITYNKNLISLKYNDPTINKYLEMNNESTNEKMVRVGLNGLIFRSLIKDIYGNNIGSLQIMESKSISRTLTKSIILNSMEVLLFAGIIILLMNMYVNKNIVSPIKKLENKINNLAENDEIAISEISGPKEVVNLSLKFNELIDSLAIHKEENKNLKVLSITDELTKLYNRKFFHEYTDELIQNDKKEFVLMICYIDNFKIINDVKGNIISDAILLEVSKLMKGYIGNQGVIFRYVGEKYVSIFENKTVKDVYLIAQCIRKMISESTEIQKYSGYVPTNLSIGIAHYPKHASSIKELLDKADKAIYFSRRNNKNRCIIYDERMEQVDEELNENFMYKEVLLKAVFALAAAIEAKDVYTGSHSESVAMYSLALAKKLNLNDDDKYILHIGGMLHDCGKIGIADDIIKKSSALTEEEYNIMKNHTILGNNIVKSVISINEVNSCIRSHHERWDGKGYPDGLKAKDIPFHARIISIADSYHAMISDRPYRKGLGREEALEELRKNSGTQFEPDLVELFIEAVKEM